ncbi:MAG: hypothetical protein AB7F89_07240 [Pirellulaceae bacterium]
MKSARGWRFSNPSFHYVILRKELTARWPALFQEFTEEWIALDPQIEAVLKSPSSAIDLVGTTRQRLNAKALGLGRYWLAIVGADTFMSVDPPPYLVLVTTAETDQAGRAYQETHPLTLHLPTIPLANETGLLDANRETFNLWFRRITDFLEKTDRETAEELQATLQGVRDAVDRGVDKSIPDITLRASTLTRPNDLALRALGCNVLEDGESGDTASTATVEHSYEALKRIRDRYFDRSAYPPGGTEVLLVTAGQVWDKPAVVPRSEHIEGDAVARRVYRDLRRADGFVLPAHLREPSDLIKADPKAKHLIDVRTAELSATLLSAAVEAASQAVPTVPLTRGFGNTRALLRQMTEAVRLRKRGWRQRASAEAVKLGRELADRLPGHLASDLLSRSGTVKAFSDVPLELTTVGGLPLALRHPVIRVPVTPGFLLERLAQYSTPLFVTPEELKTILIVRGTLPDDPMYAHLEYFCGLVTQKSSLSVSIVDVRSVGEMWEAFAGFSGAFAIVDTHGFHPDRGPGKLTFGALAGNPLEVQKDVRLPPLVFLAACDTHAVDRGQDTVALAFLTAGVRSIIGTLAPVGSLEAAVLVGELFLWASLLAQTLPQPIRWSELVWMVSCGSYAAEVAFVLRQERGLPLSPIDINEISRTAMKALVATPENWFEVVLLEVAQRSGNATDAVRRMWRETAYLTDSLLFTQLGHPDTVFLVPSKEWKGIQFG